MAENISVAANNARFAEYPYDIRKDSWTFLQKARLRALAALLGPEETVLDVGCNSGGFAEFVPLGCTVHGVDLSEKLIEEASARLATAQVAPAERLPFDNKSVDVVVLGEVLEYVHKPMNVLREAARVARRAVIGSTSHEAGIWGAHRVAGHPFMVRSIDEAELRGMLSGISDAPELSLVEDGEGVAQHRVFCAPVRKIKVLRG